MKIQRQHLIATLALLLAGTIGGLAPLGSKIALRELPPLTLLFVRVSVMLIALLPFTFSSLKLLKHEWKKALGLGVLWAANVILFILGIQFTTTIASQLLYTAVPLFVLVGAAVLGQEKLSWPKVVGILLGLAGALLLVLRPEAGQAGFGSLSGNLIIFIATLTWAAYILLSKRYAKTFTPYALTTASASVGWLSAGALMLGLEGLTPISHLPEVSWQTALALLFLGIVASVLMTYLYQYGIRNGSAVTAGSMTYVGPLAAAVTGPIFLGEVITSQMWVGGGLLFIGIFFSSIFPLLGVYFAHGYSRTDHQSLD